MKQIEVSGLEACKPFDETDAYRGMKTLAYCAEHFDELDEFERVGDSRQENEIMLERQITAYNGLCPEDLQLLWYLKACFGGMKDGELFLLRYLKKQYYGVNAVDMRYVVQGLETLLHGEKEGATA